MSAYAVRLNVRGWPGWHSGQLFLEVSRVLLTAVFCVVGGPVMWACAWHAVRRRYRWTRVAMLVAGGAVALALAPFAVQDVMSPDAGRAQLFASYSVDVRLHPGVEAGRQRELVAEWAAVPGVCGVWNDHGDLKIEGCRGASDHEQAELINMLRFAGEDAEVEVE